MADESELAVYRKTLLEEVRASASAAGIYTREAFIAEVAHRLSAAEEVPDLTPCLFRDKGAKRRELAVDGYSTEEAQLDHSVSLLAVALKDDEEGVPTLSQNDLDTAITRALQFVQEALSGSLHPNIEPSTPAYDLARWLYDERKALNCVRIFVATDAVIGARTKSRTTKELLGVRVEIQLWDLQRFMHADATGGREPIEIDLTEFTEGGLPTLEANVGDTTYRTYLCVVGGDVLARLYDQYGARLLEGNVRSFLSVRGGVNKGIQRTIATEPARFFAYNNGITATAAEAKYANGRISTVKDLQIVNGGQTTASMFHAQKLAPENLKKIHVQMKLSVIATDQSTELISNIARYANTQNKVSEADLFSNHPFHQRMEHIAETTWAPPIPGAQHNTKWFYERARGQYVNAQARLTPAKKKVFLVQNPKKQLLTKTDLAKHENTWSGLPHIVSRGAQKNFVDFAERVTAEWSAKEADFNERWFKHSVAKAIVFRSAEHLIENQDWYVGGYRANIVTHGIARLVSAVEGMQKSIDLERIWKSQALSQPLEQALIAALRLADEVIRSPPAGMTNLSEWAKKDLCWENAKKASLRLPQKFVDELKATEDEKEEATDARRNRKQDDEIEVQRLVLQLGTEYWSDVLAWNKSARLLSQKELSIVTLFKSPKKVPSPAQALVLREVAKRYNENGDLVRRRLDALHLGLQSSKHN